MRNLGIAVAAGVLVVAAFFGGTMYADSTSSEETSVHGEFGGMGAEDRAYTQEMTPEEGMTYMQEQFGGEMPEGMPPGRFGGTRGGVLEGSIISIDDESVTIELEGGGSQIAYVADDTVIAFAEGSGDADLTEGASILVVGEPTGDGILTARVVVVK